MINTGLMQDYDHAPRINPAWTPTCYHLDTNPPPHEIPTPTSVS